MEDPVAGFRPVSADLQHQWLTAHLASGSDGPGSPQRGKNTERIPGAVSEVTNAVALHLVLGRHSGEGVSHKDGEVLPEDEGSGFSKSLEHCPDVSGTFPKASAKIFDRRGPTGLSEVLVNRSLHRLVCDHRSTASLSSMGALWLVMRGKL